MTKNSSRGGVGTFVTAQTAERLLVGYVRLSSQEGIGLPLFHID